LPILEAIRSFTPTPLVFFGGFGEPLAHPEICEMVAATRKAGTEVELIANASLLDESVANWLVELGLQRIWVSIDGATPESYADVRLGDALPLVIANLTRLQELRAQNGLNLPKPGIAFVAMQRNIADLPEVVRLGNAWEQINSQLATSCPTLPNYVTRYSLPQSMYESDLQSSHWSPEVSLPRMDLSESIIQRLVL
jgi:molybdenum cofactor biosynthesis enzyme MoaA